MAKRRPARAARRTIRTPRGSGRANGPLRNHARTRQRTAAPPQAESYKHTEAQSLMRPDVGTQAQFRKKKPPKTYRYDSSLAPELNWDGQNPGREAAEAEIAGVGRGLTRINADLEELIAKCGDALPAELVNSIRVHLRSSAANLDNLRRLSQAFLNWAGKAERLSFDVPTLPLFVHERLSTKAILETLKGHRRDKQLGLFDLFADPQLPVHDQILRAYEYPSGWVNRLILGDSLAVMNSLVQYESLGGQVQMIYMDPPYGVKFGSNFQPFVRKRDVKHNDDADMTREPEMVKAYRDTWELGLHSYLTYLRDRLLLCRELLAPSGSMFVQISDENLHHVRELMDEVFGVENFLAVIPFRKKTMPLGTTYLEQMADFILWYARSAFDRSGKSTAKYRTLFRWEAPAPDSDWSWYQLPDGSRHKMTTSQIRGGDPLPPSARIYRLKSLEPSGTNPSGQYDFIYEGKTYGPPRGGWGTNIESMKRLASERRLQPKGELLNYVLFYDDYAVSPLTAPWNDTTGPQDKAYAVQTSGEVIRRCMLMTTDPGDLVLDPTCGSGTTAYVAEQWGRRWITIDTSRVPLALARQRLLTATFPYYELKEEARGPAGGFVYQRRQNSKGEEVGGIVPHVTLKSIANNEPPDEEVLVDRPEEDKKITRVSGPFWVEATIPTPVDWEGDGVEDSGIAAVGEHHGAFVDRMLEVLRKSPVLHIGGGKTVGLRNIRLPAKTLSLSAEAVVANGEPSPQPSPLKGEGALSPQPAPSKGEGAPSPRPSPRHGESTTLKGEGQRAVAIVFGPENGAISEKLVYEAAREAHAKSYTHLYVIGFAIQPNARSLVDKCEQAVGVPATYVQATPDLMMGDLLKNMRSSQIFSVCGLPEVRVRRADPASSPSPQPSPLKGEGAVGGNGGGPWYQVELTGLDVFDPITMENDHRPGQDVPCWLLDTDYNGLCFHVCQAFFPRTGAWDDLRRSLKGEYDDSVWEHLAGTVSTPFEAGEHRQIAVKVIDDRGNELLVVKHASEAVG